MTNRSRRCLIDTLHKLQIQTLALVRVPFAGLGEFGLRFGSKSDDHVRVSVIS
jgi:hypothetical protein